MIITILQKILHRFLDSTPHIATSKIEEDSLISSPLWVLTRIKAMDHIRITIGTALKHVAYMWQAKTKNRPPIFWPTGSSRSITVEIGIEDGPTGGDWSFGE
jgi:hypothetical protein